MTSWTKDRAAKVRAQRRLWRERGMCTRCGKREPVPGRLGCSRCLETGRRYHRKTYYLSRGIEPPPRDVRWCKSFWCQRQLPKGAPGGMEYCEHCRSAPLEFREMHKATLVRVEMLRKIDSIPSRPFAGVDRVALLEAWKHQVA